MHGLEGCSLKKMKCVDESPDVEAVIYSFSFVAPDVLTQTLVRLEEVDLELCYFSQKQYEFLLKVATQYWGARARAIKSFAEDQRCRV